MMTRPIPKRILVVDDDQEMQDIAPALLTAYGHSVTYVTTGDEAIALHEKNPFDVAIVELFMSSCNGFEAFAGLRRAASPPKFIITAKPIRAPAEDYLRVARQLGAHETLFKPFAGEQLIAAVRNVSEM